MATQLILILILILGFMIIGTPVAFALGAAASIMILVFAGPIHLDQLASVAYTQGTSSNQLVVPLFILMAEFLSKGGIASDIFTYLNRKFGKFRAGLAMSTTVASTIFAALCGSSSATTAAIGRVSIAEMIKKGYRSDFACGIVMAGGALGIMIPPSLPFVLYGIITETSIAKLFMAGLIPGLMISGLICLFIFIRTKVNPLLVSQSIEESKYVLENADKDLQNALKAEESSLLNAESVNFTKLVAPGLLIIAVLGCLYTGLATPNESAGIGATGALLIVILLKRLRKDMFFDSLASAMRTSVMVLMLVICGFGLSYIVAYLGIAGNIAVVIAASGASKWAVLALVIVLWLILGCLMDPGSMIVLTIPFLLPTLVQFGFDKIWIGVVSTLLVEVGMLTPPVGLNLFVTKGLTGLPYSTIVRGVLPFLAVFGVALILLIVFPQIALFLPSRM